MRIPAWRLPRRDVLLSIPNISHDPSRPEHGLWDNGMQLRILGGVLEGSITVP